MTSLHADEAFLSHYQFSHDPFAPRVPGFKFFPAQRKPVLGQLHHLARYSQLLLVVTGPKGSGKTLLRQALVASTNKQTVHSVVVSARGGMDAGGLLRQVAQGLNSPQAELRSIQAQVAQLALTDQEVYLLVDDAEELDDSALEALLGLAAGRAEGRPHVFLFGHPSLLPRLEQLADGGESFHAIELQPYTEEETAEYLAQRLEGAGQGLAVFSDEQIAEIHEQSRGWPGLINQVAREMLVEAMLAERSAERSGGVSFRLPQKHLLAIGIVVIAVVAAFLMKSGSTPEVQAPAVAQVAPADGVQQAAGDAPAIEFAGSSQPLPLPLVGEAQPVIRQPLAQAGGQEDEEAPSSEPVTSAPLPASVPVPPPVTVAVPPAPAPVPAPVPAAAAPSTPPAPSRPRSVAQPAPQPVAKPTAPAPAAKPVVQSKPAQPQPAARPVAGAPVAGSDWYRSQVGSHYALQVLGTRSESSAQAFVRQHGSGYRYFKKIHQGQPLYVVTYGSFASREAAQAAIRTLPANVQAGKPWPKTFASIQQEAQMR